MLTINIYSQKTEKNIFNYSITYEEISSVKNNKSKSEGNKQIEYNNFSFLEIISTIFDIDKRNIYIAPNGTFNPKVNVKIVSKENISKPKLKKAFIIFLEKNIVESINIQKEPTTTFLLEPNKNEKASFCKNKIDKNQIISINRTWKAKCVSLQNIAHKIYEWYGFKTLISNDNNQLFNVTLYHYNSWKEFEHNFQEKNNLVLTKQKTSIQKLKIKLKK